MPEPAAGVVAGRGPVDDETMLGLYNGRDALALLRATTRRARHGIYLGASANGPLYAPPEEAALVLGPPRSGKTTSFVVPNVLAACGPVMVASTKNDVMEATYRARSRGGPCAAFDPGGEVVPPAGVEPIGWTPLRSSADFDGAAMVASAMTGAARPGGSGAEGRFWLERSEALLAPLFHAASLGELGMREVVSWVDRRDAGRALAILARADAEHACDVLKGIVSADGRELSGIWSTASSVLACYRTEAALVSSERQPFDAASFLQPDTSATLYVCTSGRHQRHAAPLVAGILGDIRTEAYRLAAARAHAGGHTRAPAGAGAGDAVGARGIDVPAPVLVVLDELANIAAIEDLPTLVAEGGGQGVTTLACLQDLSQARARWGPEADGFFSLFGTKIVLPGIGDVRTLETISALCGEHEVSTIQTTRPSRLSAVLGRGRAQATTTTSTRKERRLSVDEISRGRPGTAVAVDSRSEVCFVGLTPYNHERLLRAASLSDLSAVERARAVPAVERGIEQAVGLAGPARSPSTVRSAARDDGGIAR